MQLYARGDFIIRVIIMDIEFERINDNMGLVDANTTTAREHVAEIERGIRLLNERSQFEVRSLLFQHLHKQIVMQLVYYVSMMVNTIRAAEGISQIFSQREIVTQRKIEFKKDCQAQFGSYMEASTDAIVTHDIASKTNSCIVLGPSGNR